MSVCVLKNPFLCHYQSAHHDDWKAWGGSVLLLVQKSKDECEVNFRDALPWAVTTGATLTLITSVDTLVHICSKMLFQNKTSLYPDWCFSSDLHPHYTTIKLFHFIHVHWHMITSENGVRTLNMTFVADCSYPGFPLASIGSCNMIKYRLWLHSYWYQGQQCEQNLLLPL